MTMNSQIDITDILAPVQVPTLLIHRKDDTAVDSEASRYMAERIPNAKYVELKGRDHIPWVGENTYQIVDEMAQFLMGDWKHIEVDRVLATVLFTDIVDSTRLAAEMGDQVWRDLLDRHNSMMYKLIGRYRGRAIKSTGDGFLATFDGPARAIRCAIEANEGARNIGIELRAGLHTGELELIGEDVGGIAVHIASRVLSKAGDSQVWVSRTVKDLVVGSNLAFNPQVEFDLKGIPGEWRLFSVEG